MLSVYIATVGFCRPGGPNIVGDIGETLDVIFKKKGILLEIKMNFRKDFIYIYRNEIPFAIHID